MTGLPREVAVHVLLAGRVQGVNFRHFTRTRAEEQGIDGWVRNLPDGRVEAFLQGPEPGVVSVLEWMKGGGPPSGRVDDMKVEKRPLDGDVIEFEIRS